MKIFWPFLGGYENFLDYLATKNCFGGGIKIFWDFLPRNFLKEISKIKSPSMNMRFVSIVKRTHLLKIDCSRITL